MAMGMAMGWQWKEPSSKTPEDLGRGEEEGGDAKGLSWAGN